MSATASSSHSPDASSTPVVLANSHHQEEAPPIGVQSIESEFCFFPKLPIELRLKIWRAAFPPSRNIRLNSYYGGFCKNLKKYSEHGLCPEVLMPITLYINTESRTETLKYYYVFQRRLDRSFLNETASGFVPVSKDMDRTNVNQWDIHSPLCINPQKDSIYVELTFHRTIDESTTGLEGWIKEAFQKSPAFFNAIEKLEVRTYSFTGWFYYVRDTFMDRRKAKGEVRLFHYFRRLKEIYFIAAEDVHYDKWTDEVDQDVRNVITKFFETGIGEDFERLVPKIEIIYPEYGASYLSEWGSQFGDNDGDQSRYEGWDDDYGQDGDDDQDDSQSDDNSQDDDALWEEL